MNDVRKPVFTPAELEAFVAEIFPQIHTGGQIYHIEALRPMGARIRLRYDARLLRPGGTIMGPAMFQLADYGAYVAIMGMAGRDAADAVTSNLNITYLRRAAARDMIAEVSLFKIGRRLAIGEVQMFTEGEPEMVSHAVVTYAMPVAAGSPS